MLGGGEAYRPVGGVRPVEGEGKNMIQKKKRIVPAMCGRNRQHEVWSEGKQPMKKLKMPMKLEEKKGGESSSGSKSRDVSGGKRKGSSKKERG